MLEVGQAQQGSVISQLGGKHRFTNCLISLAADSGNSYHVFPGRFLGSDDGAMSPTWHLRLFRTGVGRCEDRTYDQHFLLKSGTSGKLQGAMVDDIQMPLTEWTARHNRWSDSEADEVDNKETSGRVAPDARGNPAQRKRFLRQKYYRLPLFVRAFALFVYRYFFRLGFLDGTEGLIFWVLQSFWYRFLVDAKIWE